MNVIIQINGREAIPVRALPWLTHDCLFSAQDVADALSLSAEFPDFSGIHTFRIDGGIVGVDFWRDEVQGKIKCLEAQGLKPEQWKLDSLAALPAGVFVWRDEWESAYNQSPYGPDTLKLLGDTGDKQDIDERTLNFAPHIPLHLAQLVMEGCIKPAPKAPAPAQTTTTASGAAPDGVLAPSGPNRKPKWAKVAMPYMQCLYKTGDFRSAAVFYKALMKRADTADSPFKRVNGELYCTKAGTTVAEGTVGKVWAEIRKS